MRLAKRIVEKARRLYEIPKRLDSIQESLGRLESRLNCTRDLQSPRDFEFKVYSQWGEDGIIDYLVSNIDIPDRSFLEFGVEDYTEANTLFLLKHRGWRGFVIDGSPDNIDSIRQGHVLWRYDLYAMTAFITCENINEIITEMGLGGDVGLLSIDIDGNDYWVWQAITSIRPRIVVIEYNSLFGPTATVSIPYDPTFRRELAHPSKLYYGASLGALAYLGRRTGYELVAGNSAGNNAFFVRADCLGAMRPQSPKHAYVAACFREARSADGRVELLSFKERQETIGGLPVIDVTSGQRKLTREVL